MNLVLKALALATPLWESVPLLAQRIRLASLLPPGEPTGRKLHPVNENFSSNYSKYGYSYSIFGLTSKCRFLVGTVLYMPALVFARVVG